MNIYKTMFNSMLLFVMFGFCQQSQKLTAGNIKIAMQPECQTFYAGKPYTLNIH